MSIKDLNIKLDRINIIEGKMENTLQCIDTEDIFLNRTMAHVLRSTIDKWHLMKLQSFCKAMDTVNRTNCHLTDWERIFTHLNLSEGSYPKYIKNSRS